MSNNHLQTSKTALAHVLLAYKTPNPFLSSLSRKKGVLADIYGGYLNADPVDVALVSPQTPLTPRIHPLLAGGCCRQHPYKATLLSSLQWVFCVFTCNHPPQQTSSPTLLQPWEKGVFSRYTRGILEFWSGGRCTCVSASSPSSTKSSPSCRRMLQATSL